MPARPLLRLLAVTACVAALSSVAVAAWPSPPPAADARTAAPAVRTAPAARPVTAALRPQHASRPLATRTVLRPQSRPTPAAPRPRRVARPPVDATTPRQRLMAAVARIPGYGSAEVTWRSQANDGHWGTADWYGDVIWISPRVPANRLYDVVVHEWSHIKSVHDYGGDVDAAVQAMNSYFGGSGFTGPERAADCMARLSGAHWTHYTACRNEQWRAGARRLLAGQRL